MKHTKRSTALILALVMVFSLTAPAYAADAPEQVAASINYNITVEFNGEAKALSNVNGKQVYPVLYGGTTYVPIRAIGYLLGLNVNWEQATRTVLLDKPSDGQTADIKTAKPDDPKKTGTEAIKPTIDPGIKVKYNGETQTMKTATGAVVYPMIDGGTTYLPIRAVSNMLGLDVDWEQSTQTVKLTGKAAGREIKFKTPDGKDMVINTGDGEEAIRKQLEDAGFDDNTIRTLLMMCVREPLVESPQLLNQPHTGGVKASNEYLELDWSTANDGYIRVRVTDEVHEYLQGKCEITWYDEGGSNGTGTRHYWLKTGRWYNIILRGGNSEYAVVLRTQWDWERFPKDERHPDSMVMPQDISEIDQKLGDPKLTVRFKAEMESPDVIYLVSTEKIDFENAPETRAKALELTKDCKTDAEKITAIFNWVSRSITYDTSIADRGEERWKRSLLDEDYEYETPCPNLEDSDGNFKLDGILAAKSGVCRHYAALMVGMLRSVGVECQYVSGWMKSDSKYAIRGNEGGPRDLSEYIGYAGHAWVAVKPKTGKLDTTSLGAGKDQDRIIDVTVSPSKVIYEDNGWIRLDPTNAAQKSVTANDSLYWAENRY